MSHWHRAFPLDELAPGSMRAVDIGGHEILICRTPEGCFALDNLCSHAAARMVEGRLRGMRVLCPMHGGSFDVRSGAALGAPATLALAVHALRINDGQVEIAVGA